MTISQPKALIALCFLLCIMIFTIDIMLPLGVAAGVPYIIVILTTLYIPDKKPTLVFAFATSVLVIIGMLASPTGGEEWKVLFNRSLALFAIWSTTFIVILRKKSTRELISLNTRLEDMVRERTAELENTQAELIQANRLSVLGQLTATVSHELRNPLSVINASMYLLKKTLGTNDAKTQKYIDRIENNVIRCDYIIDELFNFTHNQSIILTHQNLDKLIDSTINEYVIPEQINLDRELNLKDQHLNIDAPKIQRVIINALDNASQAVLENKDKIFQAEISIKTYSLDGKITIEIKDNGPGIADNNLDKIFEPLFSTKSFGVGLGLPIIRKIMKQHDGGAVINSAADTGTRLYLWFPDNLSSSKS